MTKIQIQNDNRGMERDLYSKGVTMYVNESEVQKYLEAKRKKQEEKDRIDRLEKEINTVKEMLGDLTALVQKLVTEK